MALRKMDISSPLVRSPGPLAPHAAKVARGAAHKRVRKKPVGSPKKPRKTRVIHNFTYEQLAQYFHLSQREAGKRLGVSAITMKRNCKRRGIQWPFRANKIRAARKARRGSDAERRSHASTDAEATSEDDDAPLSRPPSNLDVMSEAALLFARLPYICVDEAEVMRDE